MDLWVRINVTQLSHKSLLFSKLNNEISSEEEYKHAKNIWDTFKIQNLDEYHDLYLKTNVLLLADVFENLRNLFRLL